MAIKVGINGFGRIGRVVFRACFQNDNIVLTAINDPAIDIEYICYLIKFDSTHGKFKKKISCTDGEIVIDDKPIKVFREKFPRNVPWHMAGVQYVIEASGMFTSLEKAKGHLSSDGVRRVIVTAPSVDVPMVILGVNDDKISAGKHYSFLFDVDFYVDVAIYIKRSLLQHKVLSCASSTLYCLAPIIKILSDKYGVESGFMTSIHAMTPSLKPLDGLCLRGKHWRDNRSIHQNIIPAKTGACKALGKIIPQVKDKITGLAFRVPIVNVSVLDITIMLENNTTIQDIVDSIEAASNTGLRNIITVSNEDAVSSDFIGDQHSCILDIDSTMQLKPNFFKLVCWYENEYSYACRVIDSILFSEKQFSLSLMLVSKMTYVRPKAIKKQHELLQTEQNNKREISIGCTYEDIVPKILCSTSTVKLKSPNKKYRSFFRKPIAAHHSESATAQCLSYNNRDTKKRSDVLKLWNDDSDAHKNTRPSRDLLFNSCISFSNPEEPAKPLNPKERLENVKKEFSKMINITEDLLKKSFSNNLQTESTEKFKEAREVIDAELGGSLNLISDDIDNKKKVNKQENKNATFKECGDFHGNKDVSDVTVKNFYDEENIKQQASQIDNGAENENIKDDPCGSSHSEKSNIVSESTRHTASNCTSKSEVAATPTQPVENNCEKSREEIPVKEKVSSSKSVFSEKCIDEKKSIIVDSPHSSVTTTLVKPVESNTIDLTDLKNTEYNMFILDEKLKKRNMVLVNLERNPDCFDVDSGPAIVKANGLDQTIASDDRVPTALPNVVNNTEQMINDDLSCSGSAHNTETTVSNNGDRKLNKQDLYDKLDSASASDSDNSFQIHERKSQVIHITDLTNSIEDVSRLDKICKIIEISDELSDRLFSKLDNVGNILQNQKNGKWSFNDLCKTIQLDEFCNKVFNNSGA